MSTWSSRQVRCPCGEIFFAQVADGLHITRLPEVRRRIIEGTFHHATCPRCRVTRVVQTKTLYTDFERLHWVAVAPPWEVASWRAWAAVVEAEFHHNVAVAAPPMIAQAADDFDVRLVFGLDALAEKLVCWDAELDDCVIELVKLQLVNEALQSLGPGFRLRLAVVDRERWQLVFRVALPAGPTRELVVSLDAYLAADMRRAAATRANPELFSAPFVSIDQHFATTLAAAWPARLSLQVLAPVRPDDEAFLPSPIPTSTLEPADERP